MSESDKTGAQVRTHQLMEELCVVFEKHKVYVAVVGVALRDDERGMWVNAEAISWMEDPYREGHRGLGKITSRLKDRLIRWLSG